ncbi:unnamed protein product [Cunninghamella echinulata]
MGLTDKEKLQCVPSYFKSKYKNWFYASGFANWNEFMEEFVERYGDKCDIDDLQIKLLDIKMKKDETIDDYYDRVMALRSKYQMLVKITSKEHPKPSNATDSKDKDKDDNGGSVYNDSDLEDKLLKRFIKGLRPATLRHTIKSAKPGSLKAVRRLVKEILDDSDFDCCIYHFKLYYFINVNIIPIWCK